MKNRVCKLTTLCPRMAITNRKRCRKNRMFMGATHVQLAQVGRYPKFYRKEHLKETEWKAANWKYLSSMYAGVAAARRRELLADGALNSDRLLVHSARNMRNKLCELQVTAQGSAASVVCAIYGCCFLCLFDNSCFPCTIVHDRRCICVDPDLPMKQRLRKALQTEFTLLFPRNKANSL